MLDFYLIQNHMLGDKPVPPRLINRKKHYPVLSKTLGYLNMQKKT